MGNINHFAPGYMLVSDQIFENTKNSGNLSLKFQEIIEIEEMFSRYW